MRTFGCVGRVCEDVEMCGRMCEGVGICDMWEDVVCKGVGCVCEWVCGDESMRE